MAVIKISDGLEDIIEYRGRQWYMQSIDFRAGTTHMNRFAGDSQLQITLSEVQKVKTDWTKLVGVACTSVNKYLVWSEGTNCKMLTSEGVLYSLRDSATTQEEKVKNGSWTVINVEAILPERFLVSGGLGFTLYKKEKETYKSFNLSADGTIYELENFSKEQIINALNMEKFRNSIVSLTQEVSSLFDKAEKQRKDMKTNAMHLLSKLKGN